MGGILPLSVQKPLCKSKDWLLAVQQQKEEHNNLDMPACLPASHSASPSSFFMIMARNDNIRKGDIKG